MSDYKVKRVRDESGDYADGEYEYRGIRFQRTGVANGYWGCYKTIFNLGKDRLIADSRRHLLAQIDYYLISNKKV